MSEVSQLTYENTDEQALEIGVRALAYIMNGEVEGLPLAFRGLHVFGVIAMLREKNDIFYGEGAVLSEEQRARLAEIEGDITNSVEVKLHYYPFGHDRTVNVDAAHALGFKPYSSTEVGVRRRSRSQLLHDRPL